MRSGHILASPSRLLRAPSRDSQLWRRYQMEVIILRAKRAGPFVQGFATVDRIFSQRMGSLLSDAHIRREWRYSCWVNTCVTCRLSPQPLNVASVHSWSCLLAQTWYGAALRRRRHGRKVVVNHGTTRPNEIIDGRTSVQLDLLQGVEPIAEVA